MRRLALYFSLALLAGLLGVSASPALAGNTDWAVNGTPLAPGQEVAVKYTSISPIQLMSPGQGLNVTCASWKAKGTLIGGDIGTGELVDSKLAHCTQTEEGAPGPIKAEVHFTSVKVRTNPHPPAATETTRFELVGEICTFKKPRCEPPAEILGAASSFGPFPGAAGNEVGFPQPAISGSTLTIGASPAELVGKAVFRLSKHATLSQVEL